MENTGILPQTVIDVLALVLLATIEMDVFDVFAQFYGTTELGGNTYFVLVTFTLSFFSMMILALSSLRLHGQYGSCASGGARAGASIGFISSAGICVVVAVFSLFSMGPERLVPAMAVSWGVDRLGAYATLFFGAVACYTLAGALLGALPWIPKKIMSAYGLASPSSQTGKKGIWGS